MIKQNIFARKFSSILYGTAFVRQSFHSVPNHFTSFQFIPHHGVSPIIVILYATFYFRNYSGSLGRQLELFEFEYPRWMMQTTNDYTVYDVRLIIFPHSGDPTNCPLLNAVLRRLYNSYAPTGTAQTIPSLLLFDT